MKILKILGVSLLGFSLIAGIFVYSTSAAEVESFSSDAPYAYRISWQSPDPRLDPHEPDFLKITIQNIGQEAWTAEDLRLGSIYFDGTPDRESEFATSEWIDQSRIRPASLEGDEVVYPGGRVRFDIPIRAVGRTGLYREAFRPVLEHIDWMDGRSIEWMIQVGSSLSYQSSEEEKHVIILLDEQRLLAVEDKVIIMDTPISSGKAGYSTPTGLFRIMNHADTAYSSEYKLYMDNWMALSSLENGFRGYGLHALPFWRVKPGGPYAGEEGEVINGRLYTQGRLYEDYAHLGEKRSHGCVRLGIVAAQVLYDWADNGTLVEIV